MAPLFGWWFLTLILGWLALPLTFLIFRHLPDKGYGISKVFALLFLGYLTWIFGYASFSFLTPFFAVFVLITLSVLLFSQAWIPIRDFFKVQLGYILVVEALFFMGFLLAGAYKMQTHDIVGTEKPMDFAMINGILASPSMPPQDPWLSGGGISYYYFGYLIVAMMCRLTGVISGMGYNLGVVLTWALAAIAAFSLAYNLTKRYRYSIFSALSVTVLGNLDFWHRAIQSIGMGDLRIGYYNFPANPQAETGVGAFFSFVFSPIAHYWDYFQASRIIPVPPTDKMINEFPSFSFFLSDLHPHVMAIPFILLAMTMAFNLMKAPLPNLQIFGGNRVWQIGQWILVALVFGESAFMNSWDFPMLLLLLGICLGLQQRWAAPKALFDWFKGLALVGLPIVAGCFIFYAPFYLKFQSQANGLGLVTNRTDLYYLAVIFGLFFLIVIPALASRALQPSLEKSPKTKASKAEILVCVVCGEEGSGKKFCGRCGGELASPTNLDTPIPFEEVRKFFQTCSQWLSADPFRGWMAAGVVLLLLSLLNIAPVQLAVLFLCLVMIFLALLSLSGKTESREMVFSTLLVVLAFGLIGFCEVLYIKDNFAGGSLYRMNTVFKFHYEAWILLSVASAPFLKWIFDQQMAQWAFWKKITWLTAACLALLGAGLYPILTLSERVGGGSPANLTFDGTDYFSRTYPTDAQVVDWIKTNLKPEGGHLPVILEAWGGSYSEYARLATNSGYPTILGWDFHEAQWRGSWDKAVVRGQDPSDTVLSRRQDVDTIYTTTDLNQAKTLLLKYGVNYVYVGDMERTKYKDHLDGLGKFGQLGTPVFTAGDSVLYKLNS